MTQYTDLPRPPDAPMPDLAVSSDCGIPNMHATARVGFGLRLIAWMIDTFLAVFFGVIFGVLFGGTLGAALGVIAGPRGVIAGGLSGAYLGVIAGISAFWIVYSLWEGLTGAAAGKRIVGIKIANDDGTSADTTTLLARYAVKNAGMILHWSALILSVAFLSNLGHLAGFLVFLGCFFALGESRQAFHDIAAHTAVYRKRDIRAVI